MNQLICQLSVIASAKGGLSMTISITLGLCRPDPNCSRDDPKWFQSQMSITSLCICTTDITSMSKREERWTKLLHAASRPCQAAAPARPRLNSHAFPPPHFSHAPISQVNKWREKMSEKERTSSQTTFDEARIGTGGYECLIGRERWTNGERD